MIRGCYISIKRFFGSKNTLEYGTFAIVRVVVALFIRLVIGSYDTDSHPVRCRWLDEFAGECYVCGINAYLALSGINCTLGSLVYIRGVTIGLFFR